MSPGPDRIILDDMPTSESVSIRFILKEKEAGRRKVTLRPFQPQEYNHSVLDIGNAFGFS